MDEKKIWKALHFLQDTHASVSHQFWIVASLEDQSSLESKEEMHKALSTIQGEFLKLISDRDDLIEVSDVFHGASLKDAEEIFKLTQDLLTTQDSLKSTQCALQESKMEIEKLHEKLQIYYLQSYTVLSAWMAPLRLSADIPHVGTQKDIYGLRVSQNTIDGLIMNYIHHPSN